MLDESNGINSDLSYLQSKVSGYFDKIFFHLDRNLVGDKKQSRQYLIGLMNAILNNEFNNKEQVLKELSGLRYGPVLAEAVDETDKILNDSSKSRLFTDLKTRLKVLKGGIIADDDTISGFIKKHSKPYLEELFKEKQNILQQENPQEMKSPTEIIQTNKDNIKELFQNVIEHQNGLKAWKDFFAKDFTGSISDITDKYSISFDSDPVLFGYLSKANRIKNGYIELGDNYNDVIFVASAKEAAISYARQIAEEQEKKITGEYGQDILPAGTSFSSGASDESEKTTPPKVTKIESATSVSPREGQQSKS